MANRSSRNQRLYNYLVNTLNVNREMVMDHLESRIEELIDKHIVSLLESSRIESIVIDLVAKYLNEGKVDRWSVRKGIHKLIDDRMRDIIEDHLRKKCNVTFQFKSNSIRFIEEE